MDIIGYANTEHTIILVQDGERLLYVPTDPLNMEYKRVQVWENEGNVVPPYKPPPEPEQEPDEEPLTKEELRHLRKMLKDNGNG